MFKFRCANHSEEPLKAKIMSAEASIIFESPRHGTTIEFEHLYLSHLSFNFTGENVLQREIVGENGGIQIFTGNSSKFLIDRKKQYNRLMW